MTEAERLNLRARTILDDKALLQQLARNIYHHPTAAAVDQALASMLAEIADLDLRAEMATALDALK